MHPTNLSGIKLPEILTIATLFLSLSIFAGPNDAWQTLDQEGYTIHYKEVDAAYIEEYAGIFREGTALVKTFFGQPFKSEFDVFIHPDRASLDLAWQQDWGMPDFRSQCWMVGSGVAAKIDVLSPWTWSESACEHDYADKLKTDRLITHELVHVFHGQFNASPDFSDVTGIDWFVEGLATYASGQYDDARREDVLNAIKEDSLPEELSQFWTGDMRYGLSGSVIEFIDMQYGRDALLGLLGFNSLDQLLAALSVTEQELLDQWKVYMQEQ